MRISDGDKYSINEKSDLWVKYHQRKTGRRVTHLTFEFGIKKANPDRKDKKLTRDYIERNAEPGESWESAKNRLAQKFQEPLPETQQY